MPKQSFEDWMKKVDKAVEKASGVCVYDLPDYLYRDAYDDGRSPASVAKSALREAGFPF